MSGKIDRRAIVEHAALPYRSIEQQMEFYDKWLNMNPRPKQQDSVPEGMLALSGKCFSEAAEKLRAYNRLHKENHPRWDEFHYWCEWGDFGGPYIQQWNGREHEQFHFIPRELWDSIAKDPELNASAKPACKFCKFIKWLDSKLYIDTGFKR
jgi:hypothetical protein